MMKRREFLKIMGVGAAALSASGLEADPVGVIGKQPNILFIFSDDHALRTIGAYGGIKPTPNIDRIAREGALFTRSFCANSICCPSRATILTGKHSHKNGVKGNASPWDGSQFVFPRALKKAGYQTALIGKWHLKGEGPTTEFDYWKVLSGAGGQGHYYNPDFKTAEGEEHKEGYSTDIIANETMKWLDEKRDPNKPFLMMCQFKAPHVQRIPAPRFMDLYEDEEIAEPTTLYDDYSNRAPYSSTAWMMVYGLYEHILNITPPEGKVDMNDRKYEFLKRMTPEQRKAFHKAYDPRNKRYFELKKAGKLNGQANTRMLYQRYIKDYLRCVAAIDDNVGRLLKYLDDKGLAKNTVVVYSSDQGYYTGEHGWAEKRWMYEESLMMPFMMCWPGTVEPGLRIDAMIQNMDYAPTFLEIAGAKIPEEIQGRSLVPLLDGRAPAWRKSIYYHYYDHGLHNVPRHEGVRTERYKLIYYYTDGVWELFDLKHDPRELTNIYDLPTSAETVAMMKKELNRLREEYEVPENTW